MNETMSNLSFLARARAPRHARRAPGGRTQTRRALNGS
jgi:hypothetical protein